MAKSIKCTEIQLTLHTIIVVIIGVLIGASLVTSGDELESMLADKVYSVKAQYDTTDKSHKFLIKKFTANYEIYKDLVYNGSEASCKKIGNYVIDTARSREIQVDMVETFSSPPKLFVSINGFDYQPKLIKDSKKVEKIDFIINEINERYFKLLIESDDPEFNIEDFNRIDVCYFAFTNTEKNYDPLNSDNK